MTEIEAKIPFLLLRRCKRDYPECKKHENDDYTLSERSKIERW